jgi:hypothetical protein
MSEFVELSKRVSFSPRQPSKNAQMPRQRPSAVHVEATRHHRRLDCPQPSRLLVLGQLTVKQNEVQKVVIRCQDEKEIAGAVTERPGQGFDERNRDTLQLNEIDLQKPLLIGYELNPVNLLGSRFRNPKVCSGLKRSRFGVVSKGCEKSRDGIRVMEPLHFLLRQLEVERMHEYEGLVPL